MFSYIQYSLEGSIKMYYLFCNSQQIVIYN